MSEAEKIVARLLESEGQPVDPNSTPRYFDSSKPDGVSDPDAIDPQEYAFQAKDQMDQEIAELKAKGEITAKIVPHLRQGQTVWHRTVKRADGSAAGARITSIKTWKTRPNDFRIGWKYGLYDYGTIDPHNASEWTLVEPPPGPKPARRR